MNTASRVQKQQNQASRSAQQAVLQAEQAQDMLHQAMDIGHPGDIQYALQQLQHALDQLLQTESYSGCYLSVDQQSQLQQAESMLLNEAGNFINNDLTDLVDHVKDED
jgi:hypothetical protein